MLLLASTSDIIRIDTSAAVTTDVHASYVDMNGSTITPGRQNTAITTATTTTIVSAPASSTYRTVKTIHIRNRHASTSQDVTVEHYDGTTGPELIKVTLSAGDTLHYNEGRGWEVRDSLGRTKSTENNGGIAAVNALNTVVLAADVTNNNAVANTIADVTGLSFAVTAGEIYWFRFIIRYTAAATTTGSRWSVSGPASPTFVSFRTNAPLIATVNSTDGTSRSHCVAYDAPATCNATSAVAAGNGQVAIVEGFIQPSANGTVIARFASEVASSAIVAKAGSLLQWMRVV